jgi:cobalt-zinc-cadmium efflux system membrane fusion protein
MKKYILLLAILVLVFCGGGKNNTPATSHDHQLESGEQHVHQGEGEQEGHTHEAEKEEDAEQADHEHHKLQLPPEKQKEWGIGLGTASKQDISSMLVLPGVLTVNQNRTAHISSYVHGKVVSHTADLGDRARTGQALVTINSPAFAQAQADFLRARANYLLSQKEYERAKMLWEEKAIEEKEYLRREAEHEKLATEFGALGSALHSYGITHEQIEKLIEKCKSIGDQEYKCEIADPNLPILSPISGTVIFRDVVKGEHVEPDQILYTVSDLSTLWAILDVYEKDLPYVSKNSQVTITTSIYPGSKFPGKITYISDLIDEKLRTVKIRVEVDNKQGFLKPNMYVQGKIENRLEQKALFVVPEEAIQTLDGEKVVFVREEGDIFVVRHVMLGYKVGDNRIVTQGLSEGDRIVVRGAFYIKAEMSKATFGHAHVH